MRKGMEQKANFLWLFLLISILSFVPPTSAQTVCENTCGGVPVMFPFGTGIGCGSSMFERYINCTEGRLHLFTPTGQYYVQSIDYTNDIIFIIDPRMSTCSSLQYSSNFGLPVDAPLSIMSQNTIVFLACSAVTNLCDPAGTQICEALYTCPSIALLGLPVNGPNSNCCVYSNAQLSNSPYQINLALLQCASYTSIYDFGPQYSYGTGPSRNYRDPTTWSYGIALKYSSTKTGFDGRCKACRQSGGDCSVDVYGFVCICSAGMNTTTSCFGITSTVSHGTANYLHRTLWTGGFISVVGVFVGRSQILAL